MVARIDTQKLQKLAEVAVGVGVNLQAGQELLITAPLTAIELVRMITVEAYKAGAKLVTVLYEDDELVLARYAHAPDASFDTAPKWLYDGIAKAYGSNTARLAIYAENPMLLADVDADKVSRAGKARAQAAKAMRDRITNFETNWSIVSFPDATWAGQMFSGLDPDRATERLADAIFSVCRIDEEDPVAAWKAHDDKLQERASWLNAQNFDALHFTGPGTDLKVGLAEGHAWKGGSGKSRSGVVCIANLPTEEVFTTPHAERVDGVVKSTKPLSHHGTLIEDIAVRFEKGRIVEASASTGEDVLLKVLDTDAGARRIGEVALVPHSSPISASGLLFYNTLFDENAACHIALGQCYSECFVDGASLSEDEIKARGGNASLIHIDWMIGSGEIDIDGIHKDGSVVPVFRKGEWA